MKNVCCGFTKSHETKVIGGHLGKVILELPNLFCLACTKLTLAVMFLSMIVIEMMGVIII